jgi:LDH2 family malate/lactate/ureidoglycolate dehydrogenase
MSFEPDRVDVGKLRRFTEKVFEKLGIPHEDARVSADVLIEADLRGFDCHGVSRLFPCFKRIRKGLIEANPRIEINWLTSVTGCCDGGNGLGMVVGYRAMRACLERAERYGAAFLAVRRSNHFGIAGYYSSMALDCNMIGITMSNASPRVVPTGGTTGILGTNPLSVAIPGESGSPFLLDMATSAVSSGKLDVAVRKGMEIPEGWVYPSVKPFLDEEGVVPMSVLQYPLGGRRETGGYKGYGLGLLVDLLCGVLPGANFGSRLAASKRDTEANIGHFFGAMKITGFIPISSFNENFDSLIKDVKSSPLEPGTDRILIPGEPEAGAKRASEISGVPILPAVMKRLREMASALDLPLFE